MATKLASLNPQNLLELSKKIILNQGTNKPTVKNVSRETIESLSNMYPKGETTVPSLNELKQQEIPMPGGLEDAIHKIHEKFNPLKGQTKEYIQQVDTYAKSVRNALMKLGALIPINKALEKEYISETKERILNTLSKMESINRVVIRDSRLDSFITGKIKNENGELENVKIQFIPPLYNVQNDLSIKDSDLDTAFFKKVIEIIKPRIEQIVFQEPYTNINYQLNDDFDDKHIKSLHLGGENQILKLRNPKQGDTDISISDTSSNKIISLNLDRYGVDNERRQPFLDLFNNLKERILNTQELLSKTPEARKEEIQDAKQDILWDYQNMMPQKSIGEEALNHMHQFIKEAAKKTSKS
ncbi:MAG: hypothetical protein HRT47_11205 [Candidatus Caenarcaniphilales bacterium]|nr:hypothetical protein [Candidatus Caenarcaniphilales bacterium]